MSTHSGTILAAAALIAGAVVASADEKPSKSDAATGALVGGVVDLGGRPVAGAEVWGIASRDKVGATRADADGRFRLAPLPEDKAVTVWAEAPGFARERRDEVHVFAGRDHDIGRLTLLPGTRMKGRAVDARGRPVPGATVKIEDRRFILGHTVVSDQTKWTLAGDPEGRFITTHLPAGEVDFLVAAPGKVRTSLGRNAEPGTAEIDLGDVTLADEVPLRGRVVDTDGEPAPGVEVLVDYDYENAVKTGKDGRFVVYGVGNNVKTLLVRSNDYFAPNFGQFDLAPDRDDLKLTVTKAYEIRGTAVDAETGKPVPLDTVRLCVVVRDPDGSYVLQG